MKVGVIMPQGWAGEFDGWDPGDAWARTAVAQEADGSVSSPSGCSTTFTRFRVRPTRSRSNRSPPCRAGGGHRARPAGAHRRLHAFRNPALTAKMISTMDAISGGRMELGIGRVGSATSGWPTATASPDQGTPGAARRRPRGHQADVRPRQAPARDASRAAMRASIARSTSRNPSSGRVSR